MMQTVLPTVGCPIETSLGDCGIDAAGHGAISFYTAA